MMTGNAFKCGVAAVVALGVAAGARAQVGYAMRGDTRPFHHWDSAFHATPQETQDQSGIVWNAGAVRIRPTLGLWAGEDDNVFLDADNEIDDTYVTLAPGVILLYGAEDRNFLTAHYEFEDTDYSDLDSEDTEGHLFSAGMQFKGRGYTMRLSDQFRDSTDAEPETGERVDRTENTLRGSVDRQISRRSGAEAHGFYETVDYDKSNYVEYDEYSGGLDLRHQTWSKTQTRIGADYGVVDVQRSGSLGDAEYVETAVGLYGEPVDRTRVQARLGYQWREFDDPGTDELEDWVGALSVSRSFWRDSVAGVRVSRRLFPSIQELGSTRVSTDVSPYLQHVLMRDLLALSLNGTWSTGDFYDRAANETRSDDRWQVTGVLDWHALDMLTLGLGYTYEEQDSDDAGRDYERTLTFVRALANY